jgi:hypothetical protein
MSWSLDKNKALDKFLKSYRRERDDKFKELDVEFMKALETDDTSSKDNVIYHKNVLRDFPSSITTSSFETIDELYSLWPTGSLDIPRSW